MKTSLLPLRHPFRQVADTITAPVASPSLHHVVNKSIGLISSAISLHNVPLSVPISSELDKMCDVKASGT